MKLLGVSPRELRRMVGELGVDWLVWRGAYEVGLRSGALRRLFPAHAPLARLGRALRMPVAAVPAHLAEQWARSGNRFFLAADVRQMAGAVHDVPGATALAEGAAAGRFRFFHRWTAELGRQPDWMLNPRTGQRHPAAEHWTEVQDLPSTGDIKLVWEASRFGHVYALVRAYAATGDERHAETFWRHVEEWGRANPAEQGPHWRCAQEVALRSLAWTFGLHAFRLSPASTPERTGRMIGELWYAARHVRRIHWYATRCVRNDHAISEAAAMFTVGALFPFLPGAAGLVRAGRASLERESAWQIYEDGTYLLHSANYARMVAQLLSWVLSVAHSSGQPLGPTLARDATRLRTYLAGLQDPASGALPNHGANDGSLPFALTACDYADFRPALAGLSAVLGVPHGYGPGPWDEEAAWFMGGAAPAASSAGAPPVPDAFPAGGYYVLRGDRAHAVVRCGSYRHRPMQADMLHLDVWYDGVNVLADPGTFSYNETPALSAYFEGTASHNTVTVDGRDQMVRGARFLWFDWTRAAALRFERDGDRTSFVGEHYGYAPVVHRRSVELRGDVFVVVDDLWGGDAEHDYRLHWLLGEVDAETDGEGCVVRLPGGGTVRVQVGCSKPAAARWQRGAEDPPRGWLSRYYGERTPVWSCEVGARGARVRFVTVIAPGDGGVDAARLLDDAMRAPLPQTAGEEERR